MRVAVSGSSGMVGSALLPFLTAGGHSTVRLVRSKRETDGDAVLWDPDAGEVDLAGLAGVDAVVHLAGESIAGGRWTEAKKRRIRESRTKGTRLLAEGLAKLAKPPRVMVCASAIGYYGDRGDEVLTEASASGQDFLSDVAREWEAACEPARAAGVRVVNLRFGVILSPRGGALAKMLTPFKMCVGGRIGSGRQWWSWVALDDVVGAIHFALTRDDLDGPVNVTAPNPVRNEEFTGILGRVLGRPTVFPMPAFAARLALGEMADALLLCSQRVEPRRLTEARFPFRHTELEDALRHVLGR